MNTNRTELISDIDADNVFPSVHIVLQFMSHTLLFDDILLFFGVSLDVINTNGLPISNIDADNDFHQFILF